MGLFNQVTLQTPESVELEFTLAGIGNRAYALFLDYLTLGTILIFVLTGWAFLSYRLSELLSSLAVNNDRVWLWILAIQLLIVFSIYVGYFVFFEALWQGQTPGKKVVKIRVIRDDGRPIGLQQATLRALLRPFDDLFFLGTFLIIFSKQEKRLGDWVAGTIVVQEELPRQPANFPVSEKSQALANYLKKKAHLSNLLPDDFAVIRDYLQRRKTMTLEAKTEVSNQLAEQILDIIGLEKMPKGVTGNLFLEAVYLAYQQQSS